MRIRFPSRTSTDGFTLIEILVTIFILSVATVGITGLATLGSRYSFESERQTVALGIVNEQIETVRSISYNDVGYTDAVGAEPDGSLQRNVEVVRNQQTYSVSTTVTLVDDPVNGTLSVALTEDNADYKAVGVNAVWQVANGGERNVESITYVSPTAVLQTCTPGQANACPGAESSSAGSGACIPNQPCPASGVCPANPGSGTNCPPGSQFCAPCTTNSDCSAGQVCNTVTNQCESAVGACTADSDCSAGQVCQSGTCSAACTTNADCGGGDVCNVGTGVCSPSCVGNSCACPSDTSCNVESGVCEADVDECTVDADCGSDDICNAGTCQAPVACNSSDDCPAGQECGSDDICRVTEGEACSGSNPCSSDDVCQANRCAGPFNSCQSDNECGSGESCFSGLCGPSACAELTDSCDDIVIDPGCSCPNSFGGRMVTTFDEIVNPLPDPNCPIAVQTICQPVSMWQECADLDCSSDNVYQCNDGLDNDGDGYVDCGGSGAPADPGCYANWDYNNGACEPTDNFEINGECSDRRDNDSDDFIDYPNDPDCDSYTDETEGGSSGSDTGTLPYNGQGNWLVSVFDCPQFTFQGKQYLFCSSLAQATTDWASANSSCITYGAKLAVPDSNAENTWIANRAAEVDPGGGWWIGVGQDPDTEGQGGGIVGLDWNTVDGSGALGSFWNTNEPNDCCGVHDHEPAGEGSEDCAEIFPTNGSDAVWNDAVCGNSQPFVCEL